MFHCIFSCSITSLHFTTNLDMFSGSVVFVQFAVSCSIFIAVCIICNFLLLGAYDFYVYFRLYEVQVNNILAKERPL
jgi:hypothetical protein